MNQSNNLEHGHILDLKTDKLHHYVRNMSVNMHYFYLYGEIEDDIEKYADLINVLHTATEEDVITIHINSEGGYLRMAMAICNAMMASQATIITSLDGEACSAATFIFLTGHELIINPNCTFMIHNYKEGLWGKGHELRLQMDFRGTSTRKVMEFFYKNFLTEEELEDVIDGKDIWMDSEELTERLRVRSESGDETLHSPLDMLTPDNAPEVEDSTTKAKSKPRSRKSKEKA